MHAFTRKIIAWFRRFFAPAIDEEQIVTALPEPGRLRSEYDRRFVREGNVLHVEFGAGSSLDDPAFSADAYFAATSLVHPGPEVILTPKASRKTKRPGWRYPDEPADDAPEDVWMTWARSIAAERKNPRQFRYMPGLGDEKQFIILRIICRAALKHEFAVCPYANGWFAKQKVLDVNFFGDPTSKAAIRNRITRLRTDGFIDCVLINHTHRLMWPTIKGHAFVVAEGSTKVNRKAVTHPLVLQARGDFREAHALPEPATEPAVATTPTRSVRSRRNVVVPPRPWILAPAMESAKKLEDDAAAVPEEAPAVQPETAVSDAELKELELIQDPESVSSGRPFDRAR